MLTVTDAYVRVAYWNSARYDQEYNKKLQLELLTEEAKETAVALKEADMVEFVDGLCDVVFVALGGIWKLCEYLDARELSDTYQAVETDDPLTVMQHRLAAEADFIGSMQLQLNYDMIALAFMCGEKYHIPNSVLLEALFAVCDSNDTKAVKKTDSAVKANVDKGSTFVPPTATITAILQRYAASGR